MATVVLGDIGDDESIKELVNLVNDGSRSEIVRAYGVIAIANSRLKEAANYASDLMVGARSLDPIKTVLDFFLTRKDGPNLLADAISGKKMNPEFAGASVRITAASGGETKKLIQELSRVGSLQAIQAGLSDTAMIELIDSVKTEGDPARGQEVYRRSSLLCQSCHAIGGGGGVIGPDLVSMGSSAPVDYIIDSLLDPAKKIKEGYHTTVITTTVSYTHLTLPTKRIV